MSNNPNMYMMGGPGHPVGPPPQQFNTHVNPQQMQMQMGQSMGAAAQMNYQQNQFNTQQ